MSERFSDRRATTTSQVQNVDYDSDESRLLFEIRDWVEKHRVERHGTKPPDPSQVLNILRDMGWRNCEAELKRIAFLEEKLADYDKVFVTVAKELAAVKDVQLKWRLKDGE